MNIINMTLTTIITSVTNIISTFGPKFIAGLLIILIGLIVASLLKDLVRIILNYFRVEKWLQTIGVARTEDVQIWPTIIVEIVRWLVIFIFLTSAIDVWGVPKVGDVLDQLLSFLPNVFVSIIIGWAGLVAARLVYNIVRHGMRGLGEKEAVVMGNVAKYAIIFFTVLIILTQLGVAADLVKILFTGIIAMLVLAFGLAFGLGGQDEARRILKNIQEKLIEKENKKITEK